MWPFCSRTLKWSNAWKTLSRNRPYFEESNGRNGGSRKQYQSTQGQQPLHQEHTKQKETAAKPTLSPLWKVESFRSWLPIQGCRMPHMWKAGTHSTSLPLQPILSVQEDREEKVQDSPSRTRQKYLHRLRSWHLPPIQIDRAFYTADHSYSLDRG